MSEKFSSETLAPVEKVILQTVPAVLYASNGCKKVVRCFFDPGYQTSFVKQSVVEELGLVEKTGRVAVSGFWLKIC